MHSLSHPLRCALRGASIGAVLFGVAGLLTGIVGMAMRLPVPPMLLIELGAMLGGLLGLGVGYVCAFRLGRCVLAGLTSGAGFAIGVMVLLRVDLSAASVLRFALLGALLGSQGALFVVRTNDLR